MRSRIWRDSVQKMTDKYHRKRSTRQCEEKSKEIMTV